jgi:hypothetical protein
MNKIILLNLTDSIKRKKKTKTLRPSKVIEIFRYYA